MRAEEAFQGGSQPRFVGRVEEKRRLTRFVANARHGRGGVALVTGEAGIGKTRLLSEATEHRRGHDLILLRGRASSGGAQPLMAQVVDSLRDARQEAETGVWAAVEARARWLASVLPELRLDSHPHPPFDSDLLFQSIFDAISEAAQEFPAVWVLEDMQWADNATWSFVRYANRRAGRSRVALLAACRDDEMGAGHPARAEMVALTQDPDVLRVPLNRLEPSETERLVRSLTGARLTGDNISSLVFRSAGNPRAAADLAAAAMAPGVAPVPASMSLTVDQRAAGLSTDARGLLELLAVLGAETDLELLVRLRPAAEMPLGQLVDSGLITTDGAPSRLNVRFRHPLFRDAVYERTAWTRKRLLHGQVADVLEGGSASRPEAMALAAHHRELSGDGEGALRALRTAADAASAELDVRRASDPTSPPLPPPAGIPRCSSTSRP
jgi:predicted ATPase